MHRSMHDRLDRALVLGAAVVLFVLGWTTLAGRPHPAPAVAPAPLPPAPVPEDVRLVPSSAALLPHCPPADLHLSVAAGFLVLRFAGSRCHVPPLRLRAVEQDSAGRVVYRGPALAYESLSGNYAVSGSARGRLLGPCGRGRLRVVVAGSGLSARGRC